jgi:hypothetical protein
MIQQSHSWGYTQKNVIQVTPEALVYPCLLITIVFKGILNFFVFIL